MTMARDNMSENQSKNLRKKLRQLAGMAYERELAIASEALLQEFGRWKNKEINVFELSDLIHEFHNGISRELYNCYSGHATACTFNVASALHRGILTREEVGEEVFASIGGVITELFLNE